MFVPKSGATLVRLNALMPRRVMDAIGRALKGDEVLAKPDHTARAAYEARMVETITPAEAELAAEAEREKQTA